jgi:hypothetical protein
VDVPVLVSKDRKCLENRLLKANTPSFFLKVRHAFTKYRITLEVYEIRFDGKEVFLNRSREGGTRFPD